MVSKQQNYKFTEKFNPGTEKEIKLSKSLDLKKKETVFIYLFQFKDKKSEHASKSREKKE